jgi:hypothetical protein
MVVAACFKTLPSLLSKVFHRNLARQIFGALIGHQKNVPGRLLASASSLNRLRWLCIKNVAQVLLYRQ